MSKLDEITARLRAAREKKHRRLVGKTPERFWSKVKKTSGCWYWRGVILRSTGYGQFGFGRFGRVLAHRFAWELAHGHPPPEGALVCHKCDRPRCVRPDHLFLGTFSDNANDASRKGRLIWGEDHWCHKLTEDDVREMRQLHETGDFSFSFLAKKFGVSSGQAVKVIRRKNWANLDVTLPRPE